MTRTLTAAAVISFAVVGGGAINVFVAVLAAQPAPLPIGAPAPPPAPPPPGTYTWDVPERGYKTGLVLAVHDGDTMTVGLLVPVTVRLSGINAPELKAAGGAASRDALAGLVANKVLTLDMRGREKYGRTLAVPWLPGTPSTNVSQWMIDNKWALPYSGEGPKP